MNHSDPVMQALAYVFDRDLARMPDAARILLANPLPSQGPWDASSATVWQWWKGPADSFEKDGYAICADLSVAGAPFNAALVRLPRQREEAQFVMASAWNALGQGGLFVVAAANDAGGSRLEKDLKNFFPDLQNASKHKCRIVWAIKGNQKLPEAWLTNGLLHKHMGSNAWTRPGLFSWDRIDGATAMLLPLLPTGLKGAVADFGCGTGVIAHHVLAHNPDVKTMLCIDADARAVEACCKNITERYPGRAVDYHWADLSRPQKFSPVDTIIMNPPFHAEKIQAIALGQSFIVNAAAMLKTGGSLWLVANAHLPYEQVLEKNFRSFDKIHEGRGFKIIRAVR